jgi:hypothetical protein
MDSKTSAHFANLESGDARYAAHMALLAATNQPVDWAYDKIRTQALALIQTEPDPKYHRKYTTLWRRA